MFRNKKRLTLLCGFIISLFFFVTAEAGPFLESGVYGELLLAKNPNTQEVTGYFSSETGGGQFSCVFYIAGKFSEDKMNVDTFVPDTPGKIIKGTLNLVGKKKVRIHLAEEHGGCWNVMHFADETETAEFTLDTKYPKWIVIKVIKDKKVHFNETPTSGAPRKSYLVRGNPVGVLEAQGDWYRVEYVGGKKVTSGWIQKSAFY